MLNQINEIMKQTTFEYNILPKHNLENFYVSEANKDAYNFIINENKFNNYSILYGPSKSGKTHLGLIWKEMNNAVIYDKDNYNDIIQCEKNIFVDSFLEDLNEENLFHLINHCFNNDLKILLCTDKLISNYIFELKDLSSRLKSFNFIEIKKPDDELIVNLINKLLYDKQIIINNSEIFSYVLKRINRTYKDIYLLVDKIDKLSLEKKRELTVPLIKELI